MHVRVLLFAILRDVCGTGELSLEIPESATARSAAALLGERCPGLQPYLSRIAYAINQSYAPPDTELHDHDELALIPPVSGG